MKPRPGKIALEKVPRGVEDQTSESSRRSRHEGMTYGELSSKNDPRRGRFQAKESGDIGKLTDTRTSPAMERLALTKTPPEKCVGGEPTTASL